MFLHNCFQQSIIFLQMIATFPIKFCLKSKSLSNSSSCPHEIQSQTRNLQLPRCKQLVLHSTSRHALFISKFLIFFYLQFCIHCQVLSFCASAVKCFLRQIVAESRDILATSKQPWNDSNVFIVSYKWSTYLLDYFTRNSAQMY